MANPSGHMRGVSQAPSIATGKRDMDPPTDSDLRIRYREVSNKQDAPSTKFHFPPQDTQRGNDVLLSDGIMSSSMSGIVPPELLAQLGYFTKGAAFPHLLGANGQNGQQPNSSIAASSDPYQMSWQGDNGEKNLSRSSEILKRKGPGVHLKTPMSKEYAKALLQTEAFNNDSVQVPQEVFEQLTHMATMDDDVAPSTNPGVVPTTALKKRHDGGLAPHQVVRRGPRRPKRFWKTFRFVVASQLGRRPRNQPLHEHSVFWKSNPIPLELFRFAMKSSMEPFTPGMDIEPGKFSIPATTMVANVQHQVRLYQKEKQDTKPSTESKSDLSGMLHEGLQEALNLFGADERNAATVVEDSLNQVGASLNKVLSFVMDEEEDSKEKQMSPPSSPLMFLNRKSSFGSAGIIDASDISRPTSPIFGFERPLFSDITTHPTLWDTEYKDKTPASKYTFFVPREKPQPSPMKLKESDYGELNKIEIEWSKFDSTPFLQLTALWDSADYEFRHDLEFDEIESIIVDDDDEEEEEESLFDDDDCLIDEDDSHLDKKVRPLQVDRDAKKWRLFFYEQEYLEKKFRKLAFPVSPFHLQKKKESTSSSSKSKKYKGQADKKTKEGDGRGGVKLDKSPKTDVIAIDDETAISQLELFLQGRREGGSELMGDGDEKALSALEDYLEERRTAPTDSAAVDDTQAASVLQLYLQLHEEEQEAERQRQLAELQHEHNRLLQEQELKQKLQEQERKRKLQEHERWQTHAEETLGRQLEQAEEKRQQLERFKEMAKRRIDAAHERKEETKSDDRRRITLASKQTSPTPLAKKEGTPEDLMTKAKNDEVLSYLRSFDEEVERINRDREKAEKTAAVVASNDGLLIAKEDIANSGTYEVLTCLRSFDEEVENIVRPRVRSQISPPCRRHDDEHNNHNEDNEMLRFRDPVPSSDVVEDEEDEMLRFRDLVLSSNVVGDEEDEMLRFRDPVPSSNVVEDEEDEMVRFRDLVPSSTDDVVTDEEDEMLRFRDLDPSGSRRVLDEDEMLRFRGLQPTTRSPTVQESQSAMCPEEEKGTASKGKSTVEQWKSINNEDHASMLTGKARPVSSSRGDLHRLGLDKRDEEGEAQRDNDYKEQATDMDKQEQLYASTLDDAVMALRGNDD